MKKTMFVSGGSRGIGRGIAEAFAKEGYDVAFTYNTKLDEAIQLKDELESKYHVSVHYKQASMQIEGVPENTIRWVIEILGHIDVLVCNAGLTIHNSIFNLNEDDLDFTFNLDYLSYMICVRETIIHMKELGIKGRIIMISSTRGIRAYPEDPLYGGMKAALHRACESLALELAEYGITINCVAPGNTSIRGNYTIEELTKSNFQKKIPMGRAGTPWETAELVKYLAGDNGSYITGSVFRIDGGLILPVMPIDSIEKAGPGWHDMPERFKNI